MKRWSSSGLGNAVYVVALGAYALALFATAPATLVDAGLKRASEGRLRLAEAQGTLWSGSGQFEIRDKDGRNGIGKGVGWRVAPQSLLRGHLVLEVGLEQAEKRVPVTLSLSRIELANADFNLPAAVLGLGAPKLAPLGLTGDLAIHVAALTIARDAIIGNATLQWRAAGSALSPVSPLGDYEVRLDGAGATVGALLRTINGPLQLEGRGTWANRAAPSFQATARVPEPQREQLAPLLRLIAVERGEGNFDLQLN